MFLARSGSRVTPGGYIGYIWSELEAHMNFTWVTGNFCLSSLSAWWRTQFKYSCSMVVEHIARICAEAQGEFWLSYTYKFRLYVAIHLLFVSRTYSFFFYVVHRLIRKEARRFSSRLSFHLQVKKAPKLVDPLYRAILENCTLLGYYAAVDGNFFPTFQNNL